MNRVLRVAHFTYFELIRSKMLYIWAVSGIVFCGLAFLLSILSFGEVHKIFMDLGLVGMEFSGLLVLILSLAVTYNTEFDQKAIYLQLCKPLTRGEYLFGRVLGFYAVVSLVVIGMGLFIAGLVIFIGSGTVNLLFVESSAFLLIEMFVLTNIGLAFQMIGTSMVGVVLYTMFTIFLGHCIGQVEWLLNQRLSDTVKTILKVVHFFLPNLEAFNLKDRIYDPNLILGWAQWREALLYAFAYSFVVFLIGWINLEKREFM
jgi:ABC-type transport system involved in multi-copper enzyme maturation permease subunit